MQEDQVTLEVSINHEIHSRIIGGKGRTVRKLMEQFKADIRFPRGENPDLVLVTGSQENCEACIEHLLTLEEEYVRIFLGSVYMKWAARSSGMAFPPGVDVNLCW